MLIRNTRYLITGLLPLNPVQKAVSHRSFQEKIYSKIYGLMLALVCQDFSCFVSSKSMLDSEALWLLTTMTWPVSHELALRILVLVMMVSGVKLAGHSGALKIDIRLTDALKVIRNLSVWRSNFFLFFLFYKKNEYLSNYLIFFRLSKQVFKIE